MSRRVVSLLLVPCVLLSQSAVCGHPHPHGPASGPDPRPHFHAPLHHDHEPPGDGEPLPDHDSDAVYLAASDVLVAKPVTGDEGHAASGWVGVPDSGVGACGRSPPYLIHSGHSPPLGSGPPLYLAHRALLI